MWRIAKRPAIWMAWALLAASIVETRACPFCSAPSLTLSEQAARADAVALGRWRSVQRPTKKTAIAGDVGSGGHTNYEVAEVLRGKLVRPQQTIVVARERTAKRDEFFLLLGERIGDHYEWDTTESISRAAFRYLAEAPPPDKDQPDRLRYFLRFLEHADQSISNDAFSELANAPYDEIVRARSVLPREELRRWIADPQTSLSRTGVYGLLLGLCGNADDARWLEARILQKSADDEFRVSLDGQIGGYLVLTGNAGLEVIERNLLRGDEVKFSDRYAGMQALRFAWDYGGDRFSKERLRAAMRALLDDEDLLDLVIGDLSRWEDWSIQDRLMETFHDETLGTPAVRRAIVRFLFACSRKKTTDGNAPPEHAAQARRNLETVKSLDPRVFQNVERFFRFETESADKLGPEKAEASTKSKSSTKSERP